MHGKLPDSRWAPPWPDRFSIISSTEPQSCRQNRDLPAGHEKAPIPSGQRPTGLHITMPFSPFEVSLTRGGARRAPASASSGWDSSRASGGGTGPPSALLHHRCGSAAERNAALRDCQSLQGCRQHASPGSPGGSDQGHRGQAACPGAAVAAEGRGAPLCPAPGSTQQPFFACSSCASILEELFIWEQMGSEGWACFPGEAHAALKSSTASSGNSPPSDRCSCPLQ